MPDPIDDVIHACPCRAKPTALHVAFSRHRRDRFRLTASMVRLYPDDTVGGWGFAAEAVRDPAYFAALDAWWPEQDPDRPYADRLREFVRLFASGYFLR